MDSVKRRGTVAAGARREVGQSLVMVTILLVALVGFLALVIDLGNVYAQRRLMQSAADAAALAGVRDLAMGHGYGAIEARVSEYACARNGAASFGLQIDDESVVVTVARTCEMFFAPVLGINDMLVGAAAEAGYGLPDVMGHLVPMAVQSDALAAAIAASTTVQIWDDLGTPSDPFRGIVAGGQRGWLNFDGGSVSAIELERWVRHGYNEEIEVDTYVNGTPGTNTSALQVMNEHRNKIIFVPIYDITRPTEIGNGKLDYHIVAFGAFRVTEIVDTGSPKFVEGRFEMWVTGAEPGHKNKNDFGLRVIALR